MGVGVARISWAGWPLLAGRSELLSAKALWLMGALIGLIVLGGAVVLVIRKIAFMKDRRTGEGMSIEQLERIHEQGLLTKQEYRRARRVVLGLPVDDSAAQLARDVPAPTDEPGLQPPDKPEGAGADEDSDPPEPPGKSDDQADRAG